MTSALLDRTHAPAPLRRAAAVTVATALVALVLSVPEALASADSVVGEAALLLFFALAQLVPVGLAALLLRRSRTAWLLLVALAVVGAAQLPESASDLAFAAANAVALALLLVPGAVRAVWSAHAAGPDRAGQSSGTYRG